MIFRTPGYSQHQFLQGTPTHMNIICHLTCFPSRGVIVLTTDALLCLMVNKIVYFFLSGDIYWKIVEPILLVELIVCKQT